MFGAQGKGNTDACEKERGRGTEREREREEEGVDRQEGKNNERWMNEDVGT